jgi:hypothetical protein
VIAKKRIFGPIEFEARKLRGFGGPVRDRVVMG